MLLGVLDGPLVMGEQTARGHVMRERAMDGHEEWDRLASLATPINAATAPGLRSRQVPRVVQRLLMPILWTVLYGAAVVHAVQGEYDPCSPVDPCVPEPWSALQTGLLPGVAVLVWLVPSIGLPAAAVLGVADLVGLLLVPEDAFMTSLLVAAFVVAVVSTLLERLVSRGWGVVEVLVLLLVVASVGLTVFFGVLTARIQAREGRAQDASVRVVAVDEEDWVLTVELADGDRADVGVLDTDPYAVGDRLPAGVLPADGPAAQPWVSLRAEPQEEDGWLLVAGSAGALGLGLALRRWVSLRARRRLLHEGGPVWVTLASPDDDGAHVELPGLGLRARFARTSPADGVLASVGLLRQSSITGEDDELGPQELRGLDVGSPAFDDGLARLTEREHAEEREMVAEVTAMQSAFAVAWREARLPDGWDDEDSDTRDDDWLGSRMPAPVRPSHSERVLVVGDPRPGGHVVVVTHDSLIAPFTPLEAGPPSLSKLLEWWRARRRTWLPPDHGPHAGARVTRDAHGLDADGLDETGLPGVPAQTRCSPAVTVAPDEVAHLRPSPWRRAGWAVLLVVPAAFWLVLSETPAWWTAAWSLFGLGGFLLWGMSYAVSGVQLRRDGVQVRGGFLVDQHAWSGVVGARVVDGDVVLAFGLDEDGDVVAAGGRPDRGSAAEVAVLAEQWRFAAPPPPESEEAWRAPDDGSAPGPGSEGDEDDDRLLFPRPARRHLDPTVSSLLVLYGIAAFVVVAWPYLT